MKIKRLRWLNALPVSSDNLALALVIHKSLGFPKFIFINLFIGFNFYHFSFFHFEVNTIYLKFENIQIKPRKAKN